MSVIQKSHNLKTVFKQTILSTFSQPSTWISYLITSAIMLLLDVILPLATPVSTGQHLLLQMFYPTALMIILWTIIAVTNGLELHEMTFVLSRPVSRKNYMIGKFYASLVAGCFMFLTALILMLVNVFYFKLRYHIDILSLNNICWAVIFLPPFLAWIFGITSSIFFRTFIKKDAIISITAVVISVLTYQLYSIIMLAANKHVDSMTAYLVIPSVVFAVCSVVFFIGGYIIFQKMFIRV
ncbi:MAG: hypothetical protein LBF00_01725 [Mycoplasmataceae bacterium]|jgi:hypothetical protein|nr:hypothetical protein [Mycoplasmataceae bacterium]